jgi:hypothetical protein
VLKGKDDLVLLAWRKKTLKAGIIGVEVIRKNPRIRDAFGLQPITVRAESITKSPTWRPALTICTRPVN